MTIVSKGHSSSNQLYWVADNIIANDFPDVSTALRDPDGLLAIGGDLLPERILDAYSRGIFPWYSERQPILWWSPNPRCVLEPKSIKVSRSLKKSLRKKIYQVTFNKSFNDVIHACSGTRNGFDDTWITKDMLIAYKSLHKSGHAISVECWNGDRLVGGLYGLVIGKIFFGESMFSRESDASKIALVHLAEYLKKNKFRLIDCQVHSKHLQSLGAIPMPRELFVNILNQFCNSYSSYDWPTESILP